MRIAIPFLSRRREDDYRRRGRGGPRLTETVDFHLLWCMVLILSFGFLVVAHRWAEYERKNSLIEYQQARIAEAERAVIVMEKTRSQLLSSTTVWEKLVREKLNYTRPGEVIFEFKKNPGKDAIKDVSN